MPQVSEVKATQVVGTLKPSIEMYSLTCSLCSLFEMVGVYKCGRFKGSEDAKVQCWEDAMVGGHKCGRFERSEDAKIQCWEGVMVGGSEDAKAESWGERWWEATSEGSLKGVRMPPYIVLSHPHSL